MTDSALLEEIRAHTGSDEATSAILRSLDRFGADSSIERYEITPKAVRRNSRIGSTVAWSVRAVRPEPPSEDSEADDVTLPASPQ